MKYIVFEYPFKDREFTSLQEAIDYITNHKPGCRDCCWVEDENGVVLYKGI